MIDYKTIISTTDSKVTLMQWLQALTEEFGEAKIKNVVFDVTTSRLTLTIMKEDGTSFTTVQTLYSLTADEQSLINNLIKSVTASSDGVTFSKAVSFQGNESHSGSEIHNGYASFLGDENHAGSEMHKGTATFTDLHSDDLTATDGQELVSWDGTTTALKGKADRPTYNGGDLALKSDVVAPYRVIPFESIDRRNIGSFTSYSYGYSCYVNEDYLNIDVSYACNGIATDTRIAFIFNCYDSEILNLIGSAICENGKFISEMTDSGYYNISENAIELLKNEIATGVFIVQYNPAAKQIWAWIRNFDKEVSGDIIVSGHTRIPLHTTKIS